MKREGLVIEIRKSIIKTGENGRPKTSLLFHVANKKKFIERVSPKLKENTAQDRMWKIIRKTQPFTINDLLTLARANYENARWFLKGLRTAGYIQSSGKGINVTWMLVNDPGPKRPYIGRLRGKGRAYGESL